MLLLKGQGHICWFQLVFFLSPLAWNLVDLRPEGLFLSKSNSRDQLLPLSWNFPSFFPADGCNAALFRTTWLVSVRHHFLHLQHSIFSCLNLGSVIKTIIIITYAGLTLYCCSFKPATTLKPESVQHHHGSSYGYLLNMLHACTQVRKWKTSPL